MALAAAGFSLVVRPISSLLPHEQTIPSHVQRVAEELRRDGVQKDPILVDDKTGTVLDGMHRLAAFSRLGLFNAICCAVVYPSPSVTVARWARVYSSQDRSVVESALMVGGFTRRATAAEASAALEARKVGLAAFNNGTAFIPGEPIELARAFKVVEKLDDFALTEGLQRRFVPESEALPEAADPKRLVVLVQRITKDDVVEAARGRSLFPCKTSMHTVDPRPVAVDFPTSELGDATTRSLTALLSKAKSRILPPESVYEGRRYKERLLLLSPR